VGKSEWGVGVETSGLLILREHCVRGRLYEINWSLVCRLCAVFEVIVTRYAYIVNRNHLTVMVIVIVEIRFIGIDI
jgi:hypothetical protein